MKQKIKDQARLLRRLAKAAVGRDVSHRAEIGLEFELLGSDYGGWAVYTQALTPSSIVYSFGVGEDASFDVELIRACGVDVHAFDPTPKSIDWVAGQDLPPRFHFHPVGVADFDGTATFNAPKNPDFASYTLTTGEGDVSRAVQSNVQRLKTLMDELGHETLDILKLDIEGAEYAVISDIIAEQIPIAQLLVEFHHVFDSIGIDPTNRAVDQLRKAGYRLYYVSPRGEEFSFIRRERVPSK